MANGKGFARCGECKNCTEAVDNNFRCEIHDFVFPMMMCECLCRDYSPLYDYSEQASDPIRSLEEGCLFYYSYAGKRDYQKLGRFTELQPRIYCVSVFEDAQYGWIIEGRPEYPRIYFKKGLWEEEAIILRYQSKNERFIRQEMSKDKDYFSFKDKTMMRKSMKILAFAPAEKNSDFLNTFLNGYLDFRKFLDANKDAVKNYGISVFFRKNIDSTYELLPEQYLNWIRGYSA